MYTKHTDTHGGERESIINYTMAVMVSDYIIYISTPGTKGHNLVLNIRMGLASVISLYTAVSAVGVTFPRQLKNT